MYQLRNVIRENHYKIIHIHSNSASMVVSAIVARTCGVKVIIGHSHNTRCNILWQHYLLKPFVNMMITDRFACSVEAGKWIFGRKDAKIINNAIDLNKYRFNEDIRRATRDELSIQDDYVVIGFVGRLHEQKNVMRLLDIFANVRSKQSNVHMLVIGDGPLMDEMLMKIKQENIQNIHMLGKQEKVNDYMCAMDVFVLPSLFEGLPVVLAEAQAEGLPCVVSDCFPAIDLIGELYTCSLDEDNDKWAKQILEAHIRNGNRIEATSRCMAKRYDINTEAEAMCNYYTRRIGVNE